MALMLLDMNYEVCVHVCARACFIWGHQHHQSLNPISFGLTSYVVYISNMHHKQNVHRKCNPSLHEAFLEGPAPRRASKVKYSKNKLDVSREIMHHLQLPFTIEKEKQKIGRWSIGKKIASSLYKKWSDLIFNKLLETKRCINEACTTKKLTPIWQANTIWKSSLLVS